MPTSRRSRSRLRLAGLVSYSTALASAPPLALVEVEEALTPENEGQPVAIETVELDTSGQTRWSGVLGFENQATGDGRIIDEGALRWASDLEENPIPIRYVSSDVGAHDGAQVVGLIDDIERLTVEEANGRLEALGRSELDVPEGSVVIWGAGIFDDAPESAAAQEAFHHVDKKLTTGVSMDLDDVNFEVEVSAEHPDQETMRTKEARIRAATIVAIPAFAGARIGIDMSAGSADETSFQEMSAEPAGVGANATVVPPVAAEEENAGQPQPVSTDSARGMRAQAVTKARLRRLASRPGVTFAYQTTKIKNPEDGSWVETPAAAIDIAANSTSPDDPFELGLAALNEADMLELGSEEYLAKVREAVPFFEKASEAGGDRAADAKQVLQILEDYLAIDWPAAKADVEQQRADAASDPKASEGVDQAEQAQTTPADAAAPAAPAAAGAPAPAGQNLASETTEFAFNPDQWRNPHTGQWIDMPGRILGRLDGLFGPDGGDSSKTLSEAKVKGDDFVDKLNDGDVHGAISDLDGISGLLGDLDGSTAADGDASEALQSATDAIEKLKTIDWFSAPMDTEGVGSFDDPEDSGQFVEGPTKIGDFEVPAGKKADLSKDATENQWDWAMDDMADLGDGWQADEEEGVISNEALGLRLVQDGGSKDGWALYNENTDENEKFDSFSEASQRAQEVMNAGSSPVGGPSGDGADSALDSPEDSGRAADPVSDAKDSFDQLELEYDIDTPAEALDFLDALDSGDRAGAEAEIEKLQSSLERMLSEGGYSDDELEGTPAFITEMKRQLDRWESMNPDSELAGRWAEEFGVPDVQVEDILEAVDYREGTEEWDGLTATAQGFVKMVQAGVPTRDALAIYLRSLEESGRGALVFTSRTGQTFNWVEDTGGLPKYIREIADSLMKRGHSESRAIATAVQTVKRWAKGGPARAGGKGHVSAKTMAKAAAALAEWEAKRVRAKASSAVVQSMTASVTPQERAAARRERLAELRAQEAGAAVVEEAEALIAGAMGNALSQRPVVALKNSAGIPMAPPKAWFDNPNLKGPSPLTVDDDGRIYGHLASWNACHVGSPSGEGVCIMAPKNQTGYAYFHTGAVKTAEGVTLATGRLCMNGRHADTKLNAIQANAHYDDTALAVADVRVGEDRFGIWVAGAMRPDVTPAQLRTFRASPLSGDWRRIAGKLELTVGLSVNAPGFAIPRVNGLVASVGGDSESADHELISLVAAGMLPPRKVIPPTEEGAFSIEELKYLRALAAREKASAELAAKDAVLEKASKLAAARNREKVAAFAAKRTESKNAQGAGQNGSEN